MYFLPLGSVQFILLFGKLFCIIRRAPLDSVYSYLVLISFSLQLVNGFWLWTFFVEYKVFVLRVSDVDLPLCLQEKSPVVATILFSLFSFFFSLAALNVSVYQKCRHFFAYVHFCFNVQRITQAHFMFLCLHFVYTFCAQFDWLWLLTILRHSVLAKTIIWFFGKIFVLPRSCLACNEPKNPGVKCKVSCQRKSIHIKTPLDL